MKPITIIRALAALAVVIALAVVTTTSKHIVPAVYAAPGCSPATLNGNYAVIQPSGFTTSGSSTSGSEVPWQFAGVANFDGQGNINIIYTVAVNGAISGADPNTPQTDSGKYTLGPGPKFSECTGTIYQVTGSSPGYAANIYVVGGGAEVFGISTNPGSTASFDAKKQ